ncbi:acetate kinase [Kibdelosporangium philippinense]|uniref:Acetate kinase n=1 Tax=Kibdelosporangium philippinense TaxID=211113 RepID=A0ABS8ZBA6_9PSEU|nr:acetate kinase [Kibdelosporangium philippinense]MCE7004687.1 acetate kinase [Kibdelosporangium philippinense]
MRVMTVNPGSSSLKLSLVVDGTEVERAVFDRWDGVTSEPLRRKQWPDLDVVAVRFVHGGDRRAPAVLDEAILAELGEFVPLAPLHQPRSLMAAKYAMFGSAPVVACFDTAFHTSMPEAARMYGLPKDLTERYGLRRYGFHGLSCQYAMRRITEMVHDKPGNTRALCVHMGAGVSITAIKGGRSVDTSMGFTPLEGAVMATRSGSVDPGLLVYMLEQKIISAEELSDVLYFQSGLAGMSGTSGDLRDVLAAPDTKLAVDVYVHRIRREIGAMAASLDRLDAVVFTGGVAVHNRNLVGDITRGLEVLGITVVNELLAAHGDRVISPLGALPRVFVITDREELELAEQAEFAVARIKKGVAA